MRQEVQATIRITFDADARLSHEQLDKAIRFELGSRLIWAEFTGQAVEAVEVEVEAIREEAEIYGSRA